MIQKILCTAMAGVMLAAAQTAPPRSVMGSVAGFRAGQAEMDVKTDAGETIAVRFLSETVLQRVVAGEKDLKHATSIQLGEIKVGDRVLVTFVPETPDARRIVVMSAGEIALKRIDATRTDAPLPEHPRHRRQRRRRKLQPGVARV